MSIERDEMVGEPLGVFHLQPSERMSRLDILVNHSEALAELMQPGVPVLDGHMLLMVSQQIRPVLLGDGPFLQVTGGQDDLIVVEVICAGLGEEMVV